MQLTVRILTIFFIAIVLSSPVRFAYAAEPLDPVTTVESLAQQTIAALTPPMSASVPSPHEMQIRSDLRDARSAQLTSVIAETAKRKSSAMLATVQAAAQTSETGTLSAGSVAAQQISHMFAQIAFAWSALISLANADLISKVVVRNSAPPARAPIIVPVANAPPVFGINSSALPRVYLTSVGASSGQSIATPANTPQVAKHSNVSVPPSNYITQDQLTAAVDQATNALRSLIYQTVASNSREYIPEYIAASGNPENPFAANSAIDYLSNVTVNGISGLTASEIPTDVVAANYLPLAGGTLTGTLNVSTLNATTTNYTNVIATLATTTDATTTAFAITGTANAVLSTNGSGSVVPTTIGNGLNYSGNTLSTSFGTTTPNNWTALQQFQNASTSLLSVYGSTYFGGTATSSFATNGALTLAQALAVGSGGTGSTTLTGLLKGNGTGSLLSAVAGTDYLAPSSLSATYPLLYSANNLSLAFGTSTSNTWGGTQTYSNTPVLGSLSGLVGVNNGALYQISTSSNFVTSLIAGSGISLSGSTGTVTVTSTVGYPFPGNATSTQIAFNGGVTATNILATASSTFQNFTFLNATGTAATTTSFFSTTASSTNLFASIANLANATIGSLALNAPLAVSSGGTGASTYGQGWIYSNGGTGALIASSSPTVNYITATSTTATSTFSAGIQGSYLNLTGTSATSTAASGFNLSAGCFAIAGNCLGFSNISATVVDVKQYVTGGSGTITNPYTGWDTAITWTAGTTYQFAPGFYQFNTLSINVPVTLVGSGWSSLSGGPFGGAGWLGAGTNSGTVLLSTATSGNAITFNNSSHSYQYNVRDLLILGPGTGTSIGVSMGTNSEASVQDNWSNVEIANFSIGAVLTNVEDSTFTSLRFDGDTTGLELGQNTNQNVFANLELQHGTTGFTDSQDAKNTVDGGIAQNETTGFSISGDSLTLRDIWGEENTTLFAVNSTSAGVKDLAITNARSSSTNFITFTGGDTVNYLLLQENEWGNGNVTIPSNVQNAVLINNEFSSLTDNGIGTTVIDNGLGSKFSSLTLTQALAVSSGGTGSTTLSGLLVGNGSSAINSATLGGSLSLSGRTLSDAWTLSGSNLYNNAGTNVGIGTTSPYSLFSISNSASTAANTPLLTIASTTGGNSTSTLLTILANGNVGIDQPTPAYALDVNGVANLGNTATNVGTKVLGQLQLSANRSNLTPLEIIDTGASGHTFTLGTITGAGTFDIRDITATGGPTRLTIDAKGNLGIASTSPFATLAVNPTAGAASNQFVVGSSTATSFIINNSGNVGIGTTTSYSRLTVWGPDAASSTLAFSVVNNASTSVFAVFDGGNAQLSGTLTQSSDQRLKTNIQSLDASSSLAAIDTLNPVTFNWIDPDQGSGPQVGFIAQDVQKIFPELVATTSATALTPSGTLGLNYIGLISPIVSAIQAISGEVQNLITEVQGFAQTFTSETITATNQLCVNKSNGTPICVTGDELATLLDDAHASGSNSNQSPSPAPASTNGNNASTTPNSPPSITINGDNPAFINVGDAYSDLGATITGPQTDLNLGIKTFLNGALVSSIDIDTSLAATDTIDYVATDQNGLTSTSTRTVIVEAPSIVPTGDASTTPIDSSTSTTATQ
jgi:hypothetical protein